MRCRACCWRASPYRRTGRMNTASIVWDMAQPVWTTPVFQPRRAGRPGPAAVRGDDGLAEPARRGRASPPGYATPVSPSITVTGVAGVLLAPFGGYAFNLAAITAAICMGARRRKTRRGATSPRGGGGRVLCRAGPGRRRGGRAAACLPARAGAGRWPGLALLGTIAGLAAALADGRTATRRLTFLVRRRPASRCWSIGSAFWGVLAGPGRC